MRAALSERGRREKALCLWEISNGAVATNLPGRRFAHARDSAARLPGAPRCLSAVFNVACSRENAQSIRNRDWLSSCDGETVLFRGRKHRCHSHHAQLCRSSVPSARRGIKAWGG